MARRIQWVLLSVISIISLFAPVNAKSANFYGVCSDFQSTKSNMVSFLKNQGVKAVRVYHGTGYNTPTTGEWAQDFFNLKKLKENGFQTTLCITPQYQKSTSAIPYGNVESHLKALLKLSFSGTNLKLANVTDRWEIVNECDNKNYFPWYKGRDDKSGATFYVNNFLKPSYKVLHAAGETVVGCAPTGNTLPTSESGSLNNWMTAFLDAGYTSNCDIANMHPYKTSVSSAIATSKAYIKAVRSRKANIPVTATEWNAFLGSTGRTVTDKEWTTFVNTFHDWAKDNMDSIFYFLLEHNTAKFKNTVQSALASYSTSNGFTTFTKREPYYSMYKAWTSRAGKADSDDGADAVYDTAQPTFDNWADGDIPADAGDGMDSSQDDDMVGQSGQSQILANVLLVVSALFALIAM